MPDPQIVGPDGKPIPQVVTDPIKIFALRIAKWGAKTTSEALLGMLERLRVDKQFRAYMLGGGPAVKLAANTSVHPSAVASIENMAEGLCLLLSERIEQAELVVQEAVVVTKLLDVDGPLAPDVVLALQVLRAKIAGYETWKKAVEEKLTVMQTPKSPESPEPTPPPESKPSESGS